MLALTIIAITILVMNLLVAGILIGQPGQSRTFSYGERWASVLFGLALWGFILYIALTH